MRPRRSAKINPVNSKLFNFIIVACCALIVVLAAKIAAERKFKENCRQTCITEAGPDSPSSAYIVTRNQDGKLDCECINP